MRGGALPVLAWACLIGTLMTVNAIWTGDTIQIESFAGALTVLLLWALALTVVNRDAIRRGAPPASEGARPQRIPDLSTGAVGAALGVAAAVFGLAFGHFLIYFGCGLIVLSLGRLALELRAERDTEPRGRPHARRAQGPPAQSPPGGGGQGTAPAPEQEPRR